MSRFFKLSRREPYCTKRGYIVDMQRIQWGLIEQMLAAESLLLTMMREQASIQGVPVADLLQWILLDKGAGAVSQAIDLVLEGYISQKQSPS